jgi:hypothetical protein
VLYAFKFKMMNLTRNKENEGKKRPVCACGTEMTYVEFRGYYDKLKFWICENMHCKTEDKFKPDKKDRGAYA